MKILWAVKIGSPDWEEQIITENEKDIEPAKKWALSNGFNRLRESDIDLRDKPNFINTINL
jgi:hypothetical protein